MVWELVSFAKPSGAAKKKKRERELRNFIIKRRGTAANDPRLLGVHGMTTKSLLR